jgi:hypothetical protein
MMMLRAAALALLAEAKVVRETLYRITPRNYTGVTDLDTGDAAGDAHFGLYEKSAPVVCDAKLNPRHAENILCENDALLQIPGFNVYIAVEVEMDDRFGVRGPASAKPCKKTRNTDATSGLRRVQPDQVVAARLQLHALAPRRPRGLLEQERQARPRSRATGRRFRARRAPPRSPR